MPKSLLTLLIFLPLVLVLGGVIYVNHSSAQFSYQLMIPLPQPPPNQALTQITGIADYIRGLYLFSFTIVGMLALLVIVGAGLTWIFSGGSRSKAGQARGMISNAVLGLAILLGSYIILTTINPELVVLREPRITNVTIGRSYPPVRNTIEARTSKREGSCSSGVSVTICADPVVVERANPITTLRFSRSLVNFVAAFGSPLSCDLYRKQLTDLNGNESLSVYILAASFNIWVRPHELRSWTVTGGSENYILACGGMGTSDKAYFASITVTVE